MSDFKYESTNPVIPTSSPAISLADSAFEITSVRFLVPMRVILDFSGTPRELDANIDYVNKQIFIDGKLAGPEFHQKLFAYLSVVTSPGDANYQASEEIHEEAWQAKRAQEEHFNQQTGA